MTGQVRFWIGPRVADIDRGVGDSPFVHYEGSGLYFIEPNENGALRLTLMPNVEFIRPHWKSFTPVNPSLSWTLQAKIVLN